MCLNANVNELLRSTGICNLAGVRASEELFRTEKNKMFAFNVQNAKQYCTRPPLASTGLFCSRSGVAILSPAGWRYYRQAEIHIAISPGTLAIIKTSDSPKPTEIIPKPVEIVPKPSEPIPKPTEPPVVV